MNGGVRRTQMFQGRETRMRTPRDHDLFSTTRSLLLGSTSARWLGIRRGAGGRCAMRARSRQPLRSHAVLTLLGSLLILTVSAASDALAAGSWSTTGSMTVARIQHAATRLVDGRVLVTGSFNPDGSDLASAE